MAPPSPGNGQPIQFRRGEMIFAEGAPADQVYVLQSGIVSLVVKRGDQTIEIQQIAANQIFGEEPWCGRAVRQTGAVANNEVTVVPLGAISATAAMEAGSPLLTALSRSLIERLKTLGQDLWKARIEAADPTPCPPERVTKLFAVIYHCARYTGTANGGATTVIWPAFKKYTQRMFLESPVRLENAVNILVRLGHARLQFIPCETDPEAPDELGYVHFTDLEAVRSFYEFFRAHGKASEPAGGARSPDPAHEGFLREIAAWNAAGKVTLETGGAADGVDAA